MTVRAVLIVLSSAVLVACASQLVPEPAPQSRAPLPASTLFVPARPSPLNARVRWTLNAQGWHLVKYTAGAGNTPADSQAMANQGRYRLTLSARHAGRCRDDGPGYAYQISVIENASGQVPLMMSGADCLDAIVADFEQQMSEESLLPGSS